MVTLTLTDAQVADVLAQGGAAQQIADLQAQVTQLTSDLATEKARADAIEAKFNNLNADIDSAQAGNA